MLTLRITAALMDEQSPLSTWSPWMATARCPGSRRKRRDPGFARKFAPCVCGGGAGFGALNAAHGRAASPAPNDIRRCFHRSLPGLGEGVHPPPRSGVRPAAENAAHVRMDSRVGGIRARHCRLHCAQPHAFFLLTPAAYSNAAGVFTRCDGAKPPPPPPRPVVPPPPAPLARFASHAGQVAFLDFARLATPASGSMRRRRAAL